MPTYFSIVLCNLDRSGKRWWSFIWMEYDAFSMSYNLFCRHIYGLVAAAAQRDVQTEFWWIPKQFRQLGGIGISYQKRQRGGIGGIIQNDKGKLTLAFVGYHFCEQRGGSGATGSCKRNQSLCRTMQVTKLKGDCHLLASSLQQEQTPSGSWW